jgi:hypothetical protein
MSWLEMADDDCCPHKRLVLSLKELVNIACDGLAGDGRRCPLLLPKYGA